MKNCSFVHQLKIGPRASKYFLSRWNILLILFYFSFSGCIHFKLSDVTPLKARDLEYAPPAKPFMIFKDGEADRSWQSQQTGNVIALYSDCSRSSDKPLAMAIGELHKSFDRIEKQEEKTIFFNGREARVGTFRGHIDGIKVSMESLVFNKNQCFYQLTYSGISSQFEKELGFFEKFKEGFKAP